MSSELVAVELQLKGYEGVMSDMRALDQMLNGFRGKKNKIEIQADLANTKKELLALKGALTEFQAEQAKVTKGGTAWNILQGYIEETNAKMKECRQRANELQYALRQFAGMSWGQMFGKISSAVAHFGSAMQSAGNALTRLTSPFARFTSGMVMGAGYKALNKFTEGLNNGFNRYDTMKKYPKLMAEFETKSYSAQQSIDDLDKSVRGLPTGLDEMVDLSQRFTMTMGDMERGTRLAIATNNAFLASMSNDTQRYQGMMQMQDVIGGKDMNAREWQALAQSMKPALRMMGQDLGKSGKELNEWVSAVMQGKVSNEEFLKALEKTGTETGRAAKAAQRSKDTWEAFFANIGNASSRMTAGIIESLDEIVKTLGLKDADGEAIESVNRLLSDRITPSIDVMTGSIKKWIKAHPEEITNFFKSLKQIDFKGLISGFGEALLGVGRLVERLASFFNGKDLSWVGRWMIRGNILGNLLTIGGGLLKGSRHIIGGIGATLFKTVQGIKGIRKYGLMGWLGKVLTVGEETAEGKGAIDTATKTTSKMGKFSLGVSKLFKGWAEVATMVGGTALVGWGSVKLLKNTIKDIKEIGNLVGEVDWESAGAALKGFGAFIGVFLTLGSAFGQAGAVAMKPAAIGTAVLGGLTVLVAGIADIDMALMKRTFKHFAKATEYLNEAIDNLNNVKSVGNVKDKVGNAIDALNEITKLLKPKRTDKQTVSGGIEGLGKNVVNSLTNIKDSLGTIKESVGIINELNKIKLEDNNIEDLTSRIGTAMGFISGMFDRMPESMKSGKSSETSGNMKTSLSNFNSSLNSIIGENGILKRIPQILKEMTSLISDGKLSVFETQMARIGDVLTNVFNSLQGIGNGEYFSSNIDGFRTGLKSLKFAIKHLQEISGMEVGNDVVGKIKSIISNIESAFDVGAIGRIQENISTMVTSIKDALKAFEELNGDLEVDINVKLSKGFETSANAVIKQINSTKDKIKKSASKGITATIPVRIHFSLHMNTGGVISSIQQGASAVRTAAQAAAQAVNGVPWGHGGRSGGGYIGKRGTVYRAGGGSMWKPRGTDTVPTMLTPGEFVQNKHAVDFFGLDFMNKVNRMDVRGAMNALLTKAGTSVGVGRQSIINHTINNNQRVNMNVTTNNPNFAGARMGRFVGAL